MNCSRLETILTSWNELVYMKCLLPQLLRVFDKVVIVDDFSTDGTVEYIKSLKDPKIDFFQRKFDTCGQQYNSALQRCTKDDTWVWTTTPDEIPTDIFFGILRTLTIEADKQNVDRIWCVVHHMRSLDTMSEEVGMEIRLFRNDVHHDVTYGGFPHEHLRGKFDGRADTHNDGRFGICHFKQADKNKVAQWKTDYVEKLIYSAKDINRRLKHRTVPLPSNIRYELTDELRSQLCSQ